jgi:hypothetical protein
MFWTIVWAIVFATVILPLIGALAIWILGSIVMLCLKVYDELSTLAGAARNWAARPRKPAA